MDPLLHAGHWPHPAGFLLLHRAAAGGRGASPEEPGAPAGKQDQAAPGHAAGKDLPAVMACCWWSVCSWNRVTVCSSHTSPAGSS